VPVCFSTMGRPVWFSIMYLGFRLTSLVCLQREHEGQGRNSKRSGAWAHLAVNRRRLLSLSAWLGWSG
jgi:hypothetical protein